MTTIIENITEYINKNTTPYAEVAADDLEETAKSIAVRQLPSEAVESRYLDGSRSGNYDFAIYAKSDDRQEAYEQLVTLEGILDLPNNFELTDNVSISLELVTGANYVGRTEHGEYIYADQFRLEYFIAKE